MATQIDSFAGDLPSVLESTKGAVGDHLKTKEQERRLAAGRYMTEAGKQATLGFHGVKAVSGAEGPSLARLRERLAGLVTDQRERFPSVGSMVPVSWARASAVLHAMLAGGDPSVKAWEVKPENGVRNPCHERPRVHYLNWKQVSAMWNGVVQSLGLEEDTGDGDEVFKICCPYSGIRPRMHQMLVQTPPPVRLLLQY